MPGVEESLFSLELVVEKLYIPHVTCHFPAIAFRLLDFPTILISHVEPDLSKTIKTKIARDPYYQVPNQFSELKDKHGNFMVKKGKSCLFKIPVENLKMHLTNTPLYVMIIDEYPETPKLMGNSTVPLNSLMDDICVDIAKLGTTVPSVHGDKGLFKIYSLMGKEIGYFVLGFRLLCLGPGLIPHLPESALKQRVVKQTEKENKIVQQTVHQIQVKEKRSERDYPRLNDTRDMGSMTDVEKHDAILQTMEFNDKAVHVAISAPDEKHEKQKGIAVCTQTERKKKMKQAQNEKQRFIEFDKEQDEDDGIIINNIVCPPPMFYNSENDPKIKMQKMLHYDNCASSDDLTIEDLESVDETGDNETQREIKVSSSRRNDETHHHPKPVSYRPPQQSAHLRKTQAKFKGDEQTDGVFPVLTALLNELTGIQSSRFLEAVANMNQGQQPRPRAAGIKVAQQTPPVPQPSSKRLEELSKPRQPLQKVGSKAETGQSGGETVTRDGRRSFRSCAQPASVVPKNKGWLRQVPQQDVKKSPLTFRLTITERLRLAKTNPAWLKAVEKEEAELKKKKEQTATAKTGDSDAELNVTNLSDTLTEVRRLAQKELEKGDQTMDSTAISTLQSEVDESHDSRKQHHVRRRPGSPTRGKKWLSRYGKRSPSPKHRSKSPKYSNVQKRSGHLQQSEDGMKEGGIKIRRTASAESDEASQRSDQLSQKSIEVHLPSAQLDDDDDYESDRTLDDIPEDKREDAGSKFPGFGQANESFPESIDGQLNESLSETKDSDQPLESTRLSTNERKAKMRESSDYDTRQFMSTDEPELQGLMSDEDDRSDVVVSGRHGRLSGAVVSASIASSVHKFPVVNPVASEQSPVPATRRSTIKLDLGPSRELTPQPDTPRSQGSSRRPTPRPRRPTKLIRESLHTDSISSYQPSDPDNALVSLSSDANYSDDFHPVGSEFDDSLTDISSPDIMYPRLIPSTKLGYTIA